jgi:hypothetical protein
LEQEAGDQETQAAGGSAVTSAVLCLGFTLSLFSTSLFDFHMVSQDVKQISVQVLSCNTVKKLFNLMK